MSGYSYCVFFMLHFIFDKFMEVLITWLALKQNTTAFSQWKTMLFDDFQYNRNLRDFLWETLMESKAEKLPGDISSVV